MVFLCSCGGLIWENKVHACATRRCSCGWLQYEGRGHCCGYKPDYSKPPTDWEFCMGYRCLDEWMGSPTWGKRSPSLFGTKNQETRILNTSSSMEEIKNFQQTGSFHDYCNSFDILLTKVVLSEDYATSLFVNGLKYEIKWWVMFLRPKTLNEAYEMAKNQDNLLTTCFGNKEFKKLESRFFGANNDEEFSESKIQTFYESENGVEVQETIDQDVMFETGFGSLNQEKESDVEKNQVHGDFCKNAYEKEASSLDLKKNSNDSKRNEDDSEINKEFRTEIKDSANSCHSIKKWNQIGCEVKGRLADGYAAAIMKVCSNSNYFFNNHMNLWKVESFNNHVGWYEIYELYQLMFKYKKGVRRWLVKWKRKNIVKREELQELHLQEPQTSMRFNVIFLFCTPTDYIIRVWIITINELSSIWEALSVTMFPRVEMSTYSTDEGGPIIVEVKESKNEIILDVARLIIINQVRKVRVLRLADEFAQNFIHGKSPMFWLGSSCAILVVPSVFSSRSTHDFTSNMFQLKVSYVDILIHLITTLRVTYIFVAKTVKQYVVDSCRTGPTTIVIFGYPGAPFIEVTRQRIFVMGKRIKNGVERTMMIENYEQWSWCFNMEILLNMDDSFALASISLYGYFSSYCKLAAKVTEVGNLVWKSNSVGMIRSYMMLRMGQMIIRSCDLDEAQEFSKFGFDSFD